MAESKPIAPVAEQAMALLLRPVRHAVNNLSMVVTANLDSAVPKLPQGEVVTRQVNRAREAAIDYDQLARGYLALGREEGTRPVPASRMIQELLPLLILAAGGPVELRILGNAVVERRSPILDGALIVAASGGAGLPAGPRPPLRLDGAKLSFGWPIPPEAREALLSLGASIEPEGDGVVVTLPPG
ncbi:hypothetical protein J8J14_06480 [Roseomonas sp. SSH11]|uniref:Histidine kinase n=1 Tax=Pararoseomonas baculiformis TaxID=2820812 RepID=A0ABS4ABN8_9PROT|nr:hypothetical protein [Pararoseomonas baculiformis]MBP0444422.1 hypothetical protein [Pararoseomonas baculiformis]